MHQQREKQDSNRKTQIHRKLDVTRTQNSPVNQEKKLIFTERQSVKYGTQQRAWRLRVFKTSFNTSYRTEMDEEGGCQRRHGSLFQPREKNKKHPFPFCRSSSTSLNVCKFRRQSYKRGNQVTINSTSPNCMYLQTLC